MIKLGNSIFLKHNGMVTYVIKLAEEELERERENIKIWESISNTLNLYSLTHDIYNSYGN